MEKNVKTCKVFLNENQNPKEAQRLDYEADANAYTEVVEENLSARMGLER